MILSLSLWMVSAFLMGKTRVFKDPEAWLPWRYRDTLQADAFLKAA